MAGEIGNNALAVANPAAPPLPPILEEVLASPGSFTLVQAIDIATRYMAGKSSDSGKEAFRFSVNPSLSFPPVDIQSLHFDEAHPDGPKAMMMLNLMGLHGAGSPLPTYFTEYVAQHSDEADALRDFFDIFNHRIISLLHPVWKKYRYYAAYRQFAEDGLSNRFFSFLGAGLPEIRKAKNIKWPRLMAYMGLISLSGEASGSLESILRHYFDYPYITVIPCIRRWVPVPEDQQNKLGIENCTLGEDFILGDEIPDQTGKFRLRIDNLDWASFLSFLPCNEKFTELQTVVKYVLKSRLDFDVELRLKPGEVRPWILGEEQSETLLGWSTWAGTDTDGAIILETEQGEL